MRGLSEGPLGPVEFLGLMDCWMGRPKVLLMQKDLINAPSMITDAVPGPLGLPDIGLSDYAYWPDIDFFLSSQISGNFLDLWSLCLTAVSRIQRTKAEDIT